MEYVWTLGNNGKKIDKEILDMALSQGVQFMIPDGHDRNDDKQLKQAK